MPTRHDRALLARLLVAAPLVSLVAACGSTAPPPATGQAAGNDLGVSGTGVPPSSTAVASIPGSGMPVEGEGTAATAGAAARSGPAGVAPAGGPVPVDRPLAARSALKVGFMITDFSAIARAYGFSGSADVLRGFKDIVAYLNKNGGLGGHTIKPDYYYLDGASTNGTTAYQAACTHFVQDKHVQLVVTDGNFDPTFEACLAQAHVPHVDVNKYGLDAAGQRQYADYLSPLSFGVDRYTRALVETAVATRMIASGQRIGVVIEGCPANSRTYDQVWVPLAKRHGLLVESVQTLCNNGTGDLGNETAQIQSAVLKFRADGVTSVSFVSLNEGFIAVLFAQNAQQQDWHPQYLMSSQSTTERGVESQGNGLNFPPGQLPQIRGIGWLPTTDVGSSAPTPTAGQRVQRALCHRMSPTDAGAANAPDPGVRLDFIQHYLMECDTMLLLRAALQAGGGLTVPELRAEISTALGSFVSVSNLSASLRFPASRSDGQDTVAPFSYNEKCGCMRYTGPQRRFS